MATKKKKKTENMWRMIFCVLAFMLLSPQTLKASYGERTQIIDGIIYDQNTSNGGYIDSYRVTGCLANVTTANIREKIDGCPVTYIAHRAFSGCSSLISVTIPNSIGSIGDYAFSGCSSLISVTIPNSITLIGYEVYRGCSSLSTIVIPNSVEEIWSSAFNGCTALEEVIFEDGEGILKLPIDYHVHCGYDDSDHEVAAFNDCPNLHKIYLGRVIETPLYDNDSMYSYMKHRGPFGDAPVKEVVFGPKVNALTTHLFANMTELQNLTIPSSVNLMLEDVFWECSGLKTLTFEASEEPIYMVGGLGQSGLEVLNLNRPLYEGNITVGGTTNYTCKPNFSNSCSLTTINFSSQIKSIAASMFSGCTSLRSITIPSHITKVGDRAFNGCTALKSVNIEDSDSPITIESSTTGNGGGTVFEDAPIETIYLGRNVEYKGTELSPFKNLTTLTTLTIGNKTTDINNFLFYGCSNISMMSVPSSVKRVGAYAFYDCNQSRSLTISKSVTEIGEYAFYNCKNLTRLTIPASVETIGDYAFRSCSGLTTIKIGDKVETIGDYAFLDCYSATDIVIGESVKKIGNNAFYNCQAWENINIPNSVETIGNDVFALCIGATSAHIGNSVKSLGMRCFTDCESLETLSIGPSVEEIGDMAFFNCENLKDIHVHALVPPTAPESVFSDYKAMLYVPTGKVSDYKNALDDCWPLFSSYAEFIPESGVDEILDEFNGDRPLEVYDFSGLYVGDSVDGLAPGIYIVRQGSKVRKIMVK